MGTRHLICVMKDNEYKVAQYGQWDGYPDSQGIDILNFLKKYDKEKFLSKLDKYVEFGTEEELKDQWKQCGAGDDEWADSKVANKHRELFPENSRDTGANILNIIQKTKRKLLLKNTIDFAADSLFCEYVYVIDFDKNAYEIYEGYNHTFLDPSERFAFLIKKDESEHILDKLTNSEDEFFPVKFLKSFNLDFLPDKKNFLKELGSEDE